MKNAIEIKDVMKKYDTFELHVNLNIPSGCIIGLIGENGAGKTTLMKAILNIIHMNQGTISIFGKDSRQFENLIKEEIGVVLDNMFFPEILSPKDLDSIMKDIYQTWDTKLYRNYLEQFQIPIDKQIKKLSKGMRKKLEIAVALSHHPKLLLLDEPTSGLDPVVRNEILEIFLQFISDEEHTILLSTHITSDLEHIADYIVFMDKGKIVLNETRDQIMDQYRIIKCEVSDFEKINPKDMIAYQKQKYAYHVLTKESKNYPNMVADKVSLEELMVLMIKGEKL